MRYFLNFIGFGFILLFGCTEIDSDQLAQIGNYRLSKSEFEQRLNLNPEYAMFSNKNAAKKKLLETLIIEKLIYQAFKKEVKKDSALQFFLTLRNKEHIIEAFRADSVENTIHIGTNEIKQAMRKSKRNLAIKYAAFSKYEEAKTVKEQIEAGKPFELAVLNYLQKSGALNVVPVKTIEWSKEPPELENAAYELLEGKTSEPIYALNEFYLIKLDSVSDSGKNYTEASIQNILFKNKVKKAYRQFYHRTVAPKLPAVKKDILNRLVEVLTRDLTFDKESAGVQGALKFNVNDITKNETDLRSNVLARFFDSTELPVADFLRQLKYGPFAFDYSSEDNFKRSFQKNTYLFFELETIFLIAKGNGYLQNKVVEKKDNIWKSYMVAQYISEQKKEKSAQNSGAAASLEEKLLKTMNQSSIKINRNIFQGIKMSAQKTSFQKAHFANRAVVPPAAGYAKMPRIEQKIETLLSRAKI
jgi:hypothetical protein